MKLKISLILMFILMLTGCDSKDEKKEISSNQIVKKQAQKEKTLQPSTNQTKNSDKKIKTEQISKDTLLSTNNSDKITHEANNKDSIKTEISGKTLYSSCQSCHGMKAEKKALNRSQIIADWSEENIIQALQGYQDKTYGGPMKNIMYKYVAKLSKNQIEQIAHYIKSLKK